MTTMVATAAPARRRNRRRWARRATGARSGVGAGARPASARSREPGSFIGDLLEPFAEGGAAPRQMDLDRPFGTPQQRSEEHTSELQSRGHLVCRLLLEKK